MAAEPIEGMADLKAKLARLDEQILDGARNAVRDAVDRVHGDARSRVPVDTGALRDGITPRVHGGGLSGEVGVIGDELYYATYVEHGTSTRPAQPFMQPAAEGERAKFVRRVIDDVKKHLR